MEIIQKVNLHNEFTIVCKNINTGEKKKYKAYNTVLNQGIDKFIMALAPFNSTLAHSYTGINEYNRIMCPNYGSLAISYYSNQDCIFGGYISVGSGNTTPDATDTALNSYIGSKKASHYDHGIVEYGDSIYGFYTQKCTLDPSDYIGETIREVGLSSKDNDTGNGLSTRALIKDAEDNTISITKTDTMQIDIYCKVYITLGDMNYNNTKWVKGFNFYALASIVAHNRSVGTYWYYNGWDDPNYIVVSVGSSDATINNSDTPNINELFTKNEIPVADTANKKLVISTRIETAEGIGKVKEVGSSFYIRRDYGSDAVSEFEALPSDNRKLSIFRSVLPIPGVFEYHQFTTEQIGTGDGSEIDFTLGVTDNASNRYIWNEIIPGSLHVFIDSVETTAFTYEDSTGTVTFSSGPAQDAVITASWQVPYIPKDASHVLDISFALQFGEGSIPT